MKVLKNNVLVRQTEAIECAPLRTIKIIPFREKSEWELFPKYNIGTTK